MFRLIGVLFLLTPLVLSAQNKSVTLSGKLQDKTNKQALAYANVVLKTEKDSAFVVGTISDDNGVFSLLAPKKGNYILESSLVGYTTQRQQVLVGELSAFLDLGIIPMSENTAILREVVVTAKQEEVSGKLDKKTYSVADNISQAGGSVLQAMSNLPSVTVQDGKVLLRGSDKIAVLIDGKQTALTGFGSQKGLENIPASAIERIEIINNPSAKYDANGNAGIINIIFKKNNQEGFNGKIGLMVGAGALWRKRENLPSVSPQFQGTPKLNPSLSMNYRKDKANIFLQMDWLYAPTLNKNEFATRAYKNGDSLIQQIRRNRKTDYATVKTGVDYAFDEKNTLTVSGLFNREKILDSGDNPYFRQNLENRYRLWQFLEDEVKYTAVATAIFTHKFPQAGHQFNLTANYSFHREDEKYFYTNTLPTSKGTDAFKLLSDEHVSDLNFDYTRPLSNGRFETGLKLRYRAIPVNMQFFQGANSVIDFNAGGWANYYETIPAVYGNYVFESKKYEIEAGLRLEYVKLNYEVNPNHNTYKSDGYNYTQPFPNVRLGYKINDNNKISLFFNRRVDRPNEVDIRIFPKYDEPELIKVGNPALKPQFTNSVELGFKNSFEKGSFYAAAYHRIIDGTIARIATQAPNSVLLYNVFQNAGRSYNTGLEAIFQYTPIKKVNFNVSANIYCNTINAFSVVNKYPVTTSFSAQKQEMTSGNIKLNSIFPLFSNIETQMSLVYLAPDLIPQGRIESRFYMDLGMKKSIQKGKGELFLNATDVLNTLRIKKVINGTNFTLRSTDYYETQVFRVGYTRKF